MSFGWMQVRRAFRKFAYSFVLLRRLLWHRREHSSCNAYACTIDLYSCDPYKAVPMGLGFGMRSLILP